MAPLDEGTGRPLPAADSRTGIEALAALLHLGRRACQAADGAELRFILVNETHGLTPYRQAALWLAGSGVVTLSGVVSAEANAPYTQWLAGIFRHLEAGGGSAPRILSAGDLSAADAAEWGEWLPAEAIWLPLPPVGRQFPGGALLLAREVPWLPAEADLLADWAESWAHAHARHQTSLLARIRRRLGGHGDGEPVSRRRLRPWAIGLAALALLAALPVKLTVLAPAELVPLNPAMVRSPLDGVIDQIAVTPNQRVKAGETLFVFDRTTIGNRLLVAEKALETARAEYRQRAQQALFNEEGKAQLAVLQGQVSEKTLEVEYLRQLDGRSTVVAPRDGLVLFDDPTQWIGRPVVTGERIMVVAAEGEVELEAWLSPANAVPLEQGAPVTLYLNADPLAPVAARLRYVAHEAVRRPDGTYAYRVRAGLDSGAEGARTGLKGTAKLEGGRVPLLYWVLRRPLADARAWLGI